MRRTCVKDLGSWAAARLTLARDLRPLRQPHERTYSQSLYRQMMTYTLEMVVFLGPALHLQAQYNLPSPTPPPPATSPSPGNAEKVQVYGASGPQVAPGIQMQEVQPNYSGNPNNCAPNQRPPIGRLFGPTARRKIEGDYIVLEYNAAPNSLQTRWYDYRQWYFSGNNPQWNSIYTVRRNGSFLPVVYAKEKILVHVCGLRFTDMLTVTTNPTGLPEGGADIRGGATVTAIPTLLPALDSLQAIGTTGGITTIGGLGFGATPALTSAAVTGIANGTVSRSPTGVSYTDANISASPEELALMMYGLIRNGIQLIDTLNGNFALTVDPTTASDYETYLPNTFNHVAVEAQQRLTEVSEDANDPFRKGESARFDRDLTNVQNLSTELSNFFGVIASQGFGTRAVTLWNNYAILRGPIDMMRQRAYKGNCIPRTEAQVAKDAADLATTAATDALIAAGAAKNKLDITPAGSPDRPALQRDYEAKRIAEVDAAEKMRKAEASAVAAAASTKPAKDPINCDDWEETNYARFLTQYHDRFDELLAGDPTSAGRVLRWKPIQMFQSLNVLQGNIEGLTTTTAKLFQQTNLWNDTSSVEQSDFITPVSSNALERISIIVQHGYIPFALASYSTSIAPTVAVAGAPTAATAASTSTPAHAVKTILVEVHRRANFNLLGGAMLMRVPTASYAVQAGTGPATLTNSNPTPVMTPATLPPGTTTIPTFTYTFTYNGMCNGTTGTAGTYTVNAAGTAGSTTPPATPNPPAAPTYTCVVQTQKGSTQLAGMVGMAWFPFGRDYFPRRNGFSIYRHDLIPSIFAATSVTSLGNSAFGLNLEPISGLDLLIGAGMAHTTLLPSGVSTSTVLPSGYALPGVTQVNWGVSYGIGLDLSVFLQIFTKGASNATLP